MKRVFVIILAIAAAAMGCRAQEVVEINSTRQAVKRTGDALLVAMPLATLTAVIVERDWQGLKQAAFSTATTLGASYLLKYTVHKMRPDRSDNHAFPSAHTAVMFANAAFVQRRYGWKFGVPAYVLATYVGWSRTYAKKHDWWDVVTGAAIGAGSSYIFTRPFAKKHNLAMAPVSDGEHFGITASAVTLGLWLGLSALEWVAVAMCIGAVLAAEAFNSAIEAFSDRVSPGYDEAVRRTKDLAAGGVLLTAVAAFVVGLIVFVPKLIDLL